jgi:predicted nucleotidyltransferase
VPRRETPTEHLRALARRIGEVVVDEVAQRAVLLTGSTATGEADYYSDVDLIRRTSTARASSSAGSSASSRS